MKYFLLLLTCSVSAHTITISSQHARGQRSNSGYFFTYLNDVTAHGPQLGSLHAELLTAHFVQKERTVCDYLLARKVTLRHKAHILSADRAVFNPKTQRLTAHGNIKIINDSRQARVTSVTTADTAVLDLQTNQLHVDHGTHTQVFTHALQASPCT